MADANTTPGTPTASERGRRRVVTGIVTRDKNAKTRRVEVERLVRHPQYGKYIKQRTVCYAHDENNDSHLGDTVEIMESRPMSRTKRWRLVRVVTRAPSRTLSNLEGAVAGSELGSEQKGNQPAAGEAKS
jgi:small subunit ribosomal protein S17